MQTEGSTSTSKKDEVEDWLTRNRVSSHNEDEQRAVNEYFSKKQKGGLR